MNIKTKLRLGFGLLFFIILFLMGMFTYYLNKLSKDANAILKDNYESIVYSRDMLINLENNSGKLNEVQKSSFEKALRLQENNLTENGEPAITAKIRYYFNLLKNNNNASKTYLYKQNIKSNINSIIDVNMKSIIRKNLITQNTSENATLLLTFWGCISLLIAFSFIVNFPSYIANPIKELTLGISEIAAQNYNKRLNFKSDDEFGELANHFNFMAEKLSEYQNSNLAQILFEKRRIETIIASMSDGIIGLDENRKILFVNPVALRLLELKADTLIGNFAPDMEVKNDLLKTILHNNQKKELRIYADDKESYFTTENISINSENTANNETGNNIGNVIIIKNITSFHELNQAKTNFISTISHELKTPLASIKMSLKLLDDSRIGMLNREQKDLISNINYDSTRLLKITGELLNLAQVESGNIQLNFSTTKPNAIIDYAATAVKMALKEKNISLKINIEDNLPNVHSDLEKTAWVMVNFLSNAIRYSYDHASISINAYLENKKVYFTVIDKGKGIEDTYLSKIFDRFFQIPTDGQNKSGTGLGLAISKDFIEAQQGEIFVKSEIGVGSTFGFYLPMV